ncbi:MAG: hypothetical protein IJ186_00935 [Bacilli bacterium]|nr:hypothetical protein [Bacilli bacterium]
MKKFKALLLLLPIFIVSCGGGGNDQGGGETPTPTPGPGGDDTPGETIEDPDEYDKWLTSISKPGHLYFHYNRGSKGNYEKYCLWIWQHAPQDLEGSLWAFGRDPVVSPKLTLSPMSTAWMSYEDLGRTDKTGMFVDDYGVIADVDLYKAGLVGGKTGKATSFEGAEEIGFLLPLQDSMTGKTNRTSDGGRETYLDDFGLEKNWRVVEGGKAIHIFVTSGSLYDYKYFAGSGASEVKINPVETDTEGKYRSSINPYSNSLGVSSTSDEFKSLGTGYQIFVASFRDSNGDGMGDIRGIIDSLDYLDDLGVDVLWLTPIQKSDSYHGYDISDYYQVDKKFGTMDDYRELLYKAHKKGMKVLMDLVLNHTSKGNVWFTKSQWNEQDPSTGINYRDVYTWKFETDTIEKYDHTQGKYIQTTVKEDAESDNPSWFKDGESRYYYYGKFGSGMPEINYLNSSTRKLVIDMAKYWMGFGLDGFRLDAVKHIFMRDECFQSGDIIVQDVGTTETYDDERGKYISKNYDYSSNLTKNIMWWKDFAHGVKADYPNCFLVGENFDGWGTRTATYYQALDSQFNFSNYYHVPAYLYANAGGASNYASKQANETYVPFASSSSVLVDDGKNPYSIPGGSRKDFIDGAFTSNHDVMRAINQVNGTGTIDSTVALDNVTGQGDQINKAKIHAAVTLLSQGLSWIYYGDELGMSSNTNKHVDLYGSENSKDIWYRQPFLWQDATKRPNYKAGPYTFELDAYNKTLKDVEAQKADANSMFNWYKNLIAIKSLYGKNAKVEFHSSSSQNVMVLKVTGESKLVIYINIGTGNSSYLMNPDDVAGTSTTFYKSLGGAPEAKGADIGQTAWGITVFKA